MLAVLAALLVALPPPLCRGKNYERYDQSKDRTPSKRAIAEVQAAYSALCPTNDCGTGQIYENATIGNNAVTWVSGLRDGKNTRARIVYSASFLDALSASFGDGASFGVLAHEVGHHMTAAKAWRKEFDSSWDEELRADFLAGCALGKSGRPPDELENALRALAAIASTSHPSFGLRNKAVRDGYHNCRKLQAELDAKKAGPGFGIGAMLRKSRGGCWVYWYRSKEEIGQVGPVAAPRRKSPGFETRESCEAERAQREAAKQRLTEPCACP